MISAPTTGIDDHPHAQMRVLRRDRASEEKRVEKGEVGDDGDQPDQHLRHHRAHCADDQRHG